MLEKAINYSEIVENLLMEYTNQIDDSVKRQSRERKLICGFCSRTFKYQTRKNDHVASIHMTDLKKLRDQDRMEFIYSFVINRSITLYQDFHHFYFKGFEVIQRNNSVKSNDSC